MWSNQGLKICQAKNRLELLKSGAHELSVAAAWLQNLQLKLFHPH